MFGFMVCLLQRKLLSARETMQKTLALKFISSFETSTHFSNKFD